MPLNASHGEGAAAHGMAVSRQWRGVPGGCPRRGTGARV